MIAFACVLRIIVLIVFRDQLTDDRDAYLALARQLSRGNGFRVAADAPPTAYRPPLYPLVLSVPMRVLPESVSVALVNLCCSLLTVVLVWKLSRERWSEMTAIVGSLIVSVDPLLLSNVPLPMTETMFAALLVALVALAVRPQLTLTHRTGIGLLTGLCALCRPTVWAFAAVAGIIWLLVQLRTPRSGFAFVARKALPAVGGCLLMMAPWVIRNALLFNAFIPMTTHGGYTLLLANNPVFYEEVVRQGWRTTWDGKSLTCWQTSLERDMANETPPVTTELERDRWMSARARENIERAPRTFLHSCLTRFLRFWNPVPLSTPQRPVPAIAGVTIGCFSACLFLGAFLSLFRRPLLVWRPIDWLGVSAWCLIISLTAVHVIYWSNMRMRAPLEPFLALLTIGRFRRSVSPGDREAAEQKP